MAWIGINEYMGQPKSAVLICMHECVPGQSPFDLAQWTTSMFFCARWISNTHRRNHLVGVLHIEYYRDSTVTHGMNNTAFVRHTHAASKQRTGRVNWAAQYRRVQQPSTERTCHTVNISWQTSLLIIKHVGCSHEHFDREQIESPARIWIYTNVAWMEDRKSNTWVTYVTAIICDSWPRGILWTIYRFGRCTHTFHTYRADINLVDLIIQGMSVCRHTQSHQVFTITRNRQHHLTE